MSSGDFVTGAIYVLVIRDVGANLYDSLRLEPVDFSPMRLPFNLSIIYPFKIPFSIITFLRDFSISSSIFCVPLSFVLLLLLMYVTKSVSTFYLAFLAH